MNEYDFEDRDMFEDVFGDLDLTMLHSNERHTVFVYGTLMSKMRNHYRMERDGVKLLSNPATTDPSAADWRLRSRKTQGNYWAPVAMPGESGYPKGIIQGEVYEVNNEILLDLDRFEGHPDFYRRQKEWVVYMSNGKQVNRKVWMYVYQRDDATETMGIVRVGMSGQANLYRWDGE